MRAVVVTALVSLLAVAGAVQAHPKLVSASPAPNATVAPPTRVELRFSEKLVPNFSNADLVMTGMKGMAHPPMKISAAATVGGDGRTLFVTPKTRLAPGTYNVVWRVVSSDTHRITGNHAFAIK
jgi:hypothetical protein